MNSDYGFLRTFGLKIIEGRDFDSKNITDSSSIVLNESAVKMLHVSPKEILGKEVIRPYWATVDYYRPNSTKPLVSGRVIGIVEDFPYKSMHNKLEPLIMSPRPHPSDRVIYVRLPEANMQEKLHHLDACWKKVFADTAFDYWFVDDEFGRMYETENQVASLTKVFSWLAVIIVCVGLYGLASFMSTQRKKRDRDKENNWCKQSTGFAFIV
ncbi:MAG: hypothetical protein WDN75_04525 [Bacteroidota bacterium]